MASHEVSITISTGMGRLNLHVAGEDDDSYGYAGVSRLLNLPQGHPSSSWHVHWARDAGSSPFERISRDQLSPKVTGRSGRGDYFHSLAVASSEAC